MGYDQVVADLNLTLKNMSEGVRIDKWLWAVRIFKTRSLASDACRKGKVTLRNDPVKPSRIVHTGDIIKVRRAPLTLTFKVLDLIEKRVSAAIAQTKYQDLTPPGECIRIKQIQESAFYIRDRGAGRPTKRERRMLNKLENHS